MRELTLGHHARLDKFIKEDPGARVVGWDYEKGGPLVELSSGARRAVSPGGRSYPRTDSLTARSAA